MCCQCNSSNIIDILMVVFTAAAVFVALFGDAINRKWYGPKLELYLPENSVNLNTESNGAQYYYYHAGIKNKPKSTIANNVVVVLTELTEIIGGNSQTLWNGEVPFTWLFHDCYPSYVRNIGSEQMCDLFKVTKNAFVLETLFIPNNLKTRWEKGCDIVISVRIKSDEYSSQIIPIHIYWNGQWDADRTAMNNNVTVEIQNA